MSLRVVTWNVNSLRRREAQLLGLLDRDQPDIVCLQETKTPDGGFPLLGLFAAGYQAVPHGEKAHNGVALLTRAAPSDVRVGLDLGGARLVSARTGGVHVVCIYAPTGADERRQMRADWYAALMGWLAEHASPDEPTLVCGDFNIAPHARDMMHAGRYRHSPMCRPEARAAWSTLLDWGLVDTFRLVNPDAPGQTYWDYRGGAYDKDDGARIDMVLATNSLADRLVNTYVDRGEREVENASDHAPLVALFSG